MSMKYQIRIKKDGQIVTEVLDRGEHLCKDIYKVTQSLGTQLSDEELPDNQPQTEVVKT